MRLYKVKLDAKGSSYHDFVVTHDISQAVDDVLEKWDKTTVITSIKLIDNNVSVATGEPMDEDE